MTVAWVEEPDHVADYWPERCRECQGEMGRTHASGCERRQVHDVPPVQMEVTEHRAMQVCCAQCGAVTQAAFPEQVQPGVQYGNGVAALAIYAQAYQMLPLERTAELIRDVGGRMLSEGTLVNMLGECAERVAPIEQEIKGEITMTQLASIFNNAINKWNEDITKPWNQLKYAVAQSNLKRHLPEGTFRILDAGGGTGHESIPLAIEGHLVDLVDYSEAMLNVAQQNVMAANVAERVGIHQTEVTRVFELFDANTFDVVLCHNVLQYVNDVPSLVHSLAAPMKTGGILSLISLNRYSSTWRAAFGRDNLEEALQMLDVPVETMVLFDYPATVYSGDEIAALLPQAGLAFEHYYGIRCIWDYWGDNEKRASVADQLWKLEFALTDRHPYNTLARFWQIIARKI